MGGGEFSLVGSIDYSGILGRTGGIESVPNASPFQIQKVLQERATGAIP